MKFSIFKYFIKNKILQLKQRSIKFALVTPTTDFLIDLYGLPPDIMDRIKIVSFCNKNIHSSVPKYQKKVFQKFDIPLIQFIEDYSHPIFLKKILVENLNKEFIIFFDIDAIPLRKESIFCMIQDLYLGHKLVGAIQTANQFNEGKNNYIGPFFMGINTQFYNKLNSPELNENYNDDVAGILTRLCKENNFLHKYWVPTHIEIPKWNLYGIGKFGLGTTYNGLIYHAFQVRDGNHHRFINKCKRVLNSN